MTEKPDISLHIWQTTFLCGQVSVPGRSSVGTGDLTAHVRGTNSRGFLAPVYAALERAAYYSEL